MGRSGKRELAKRVGLTIALALLVQGCSLAKLAYDRADWLVMFYVRDKVTLTSEQSDRLENRLVAFHAWHCSSQVTRYARWLRAANDDIQSGRIDIANFRSRDAEMQRLWRALMEESSAALVELLPYVTDAQVDEYFENLEHDNRELRAEVLDVAPEARQKRSQHRMEEQLQRWIGDLTPEQQQAIARWSAQAPPTSTEEWLASREKWQRELRRVLAQRAEPAVFGAQLRRLLVEPDYLYSAERARQRVQRREQTLQLFADISATLTPAQHEHLADTSERWARDFDDLVCAPAPRV